MLPYRELIVWQKSIELVSKIYKVTDKFPKREWFGLADQIRRASVSIPSNIAEGNQRHTLNDRLHFLDISYGSCAEVSTQLVISKNLQFISEQDFENLTKLCDEIGRMLNKMSMR